MIVNGHSRRFSVVWMPAVMILLLLLVLGAGCGHDPGPGDVGPGQEVTQGFPLTITDSMGRLVTLESRPSKIISLSPACTEILFAIGSGDEVVGVTNYCDHPEATQEKPKVGDFEKPNLELIISSKPDVIFTATGIQLDFVQQLEDLGIKVVTLDAVHVNEVLHNIILAGQVTGRAEEAQAVVAGLEQRIARVKDIVEEKVTNKPAVFFEVWDDPLMTAGPDSFIDDLINIAGGINVAGDAQKRYANYNLEVLITKDPDLYIINDHAHTPEDIKKRPGFEGLRAVQNDNVYTIVDDLVTLPGPRLVDGLEEMAKIIHPDLF